MLACQQQAVTRSFAYLGWTIGVAAAVAGAFAADAVHDVGGGGARGAGVFALALLIAICMGRDTFRLGTLRALLTAFATCEGVFFAHVVERLDVPMVAAGLGVAAAVFLTMAAWGLLTGRDLTWLSALLFSALLALLGIVFVATLFGLAPVILVASVAGVLLFSAYTAYDVQWIVREAATAADADAVERIAIDGSLALYLDLANLFVDFLNVLDWFGT